VVLLYYPSLYRTQILLYIIGKNAQRLAINYLGQLSVSRWKVRGIYLRVTVPLTNLHRDLDFVGTFFSRGLSRSISADGGLASRESSLSAREVISRRGVPSLASLTLITSFHFKRASN